MLSRALGRSGQKEAAALGILRSPAGYAGIADIESNRGRALADAISKIMGAKGTATAGLEEFGADYGLRRGTTAANILASKKSGSLAEREFDYGREVQERQSALDEIFRNAELAETVRNRQAQEPSTMDKIMGGLNIADKALSVAGGIGKVGSSIGSYFGKKK